MICHWNDIAQASDTTKASNAHPGYVGLVDSVTRQFGRRFSILIR